MLLAAAEPLLPPKKQRHDGVSGRDSSSALVMIMDNRDDESTYNIQYYITSNNRKHRSFDLYKIR